MRQYGHCIVVYTRTSGIVRVVQPPAINRYLKMDKQETFMNPPSNVPTAMAGDGYADGILRVNLTEGTVSGIPYRGGWKEEYLGGRGLGVRLVYDRVDPATDPL